MQVLVGFNGNGVITILPERPMSILALVVFLRGAAGDEIHTLRNHVRACVFHQKMDVVRCHHIVQYGETEPLLCFEERRAVSSYSRA